MEVYKSEYVKFDYFQKTSHIETISFENEDMTEEEYKKDMLSYVNIVEKYKPSKVLIDSSISKFVASPDLQDWTNENIIKRTLLAGLKKNAFVISKDFISQLSSEQTLEESEGAKKNIKYFVDKDKALEWLLND